MAAPSPQVILTQGHKDLLHQHLFLLLNGHLSPRMVKCDCWLDLESVPMRVKKERLHEVRRPSSSAQHHLAGGPDTKASGVRTALPACSGFSLVWRDLFLLPTLLTDTRLQHCNMDWRSEMHSERQVPSARLGLWMHSVLSPPSMHMATVGSLTPSYKPLPCTPTS